MNAHFLLACGCGDFVPLERVSGRRVREFMASLDAFRSSLGLVAGRMDGAGEAVRIIECRLPRRDGLPAEGAAA